MKPKSHIIYIGLLAALLCLSQTRAEAHCDTLDGPVIAAAKVALQKGDVTPVLKWVRKDSEAEIRAAFDNAIKVRGLNDDVRNLADVYFFETLVRVHRAGEREAFDVLKPAGTIDPGFAAADRALEAGSVAQLSDGIIRDVQEGLRTRFATVIEKKNHAEESVEAGRDYVAAYIEFAHYVEALHSLVALATEDHRPLHAPVSK